jgi:hypothetical protein
MTTVTTTTDHSPALPRGRLMFALDATGSREAGWKIARDLQAKMFRETAPIGHLACQLIYYRGDECKASKWAESGDQLARLMNRIECECGHTQIGRVLTHALHEAENAAVQALVFIGAAMEETLEVLTAKATRLGALKVPIFMFQEGNDSRVRKAFRLLALKSGGAYFEFNTNSSRAVDQLSNQLNAIARLAVGDVGALQRIGATAAIGVSRDKK